MSKNTIDHDGLTLLTVTSNLIISHQTVKVLKAPPSTKFVQGSTLSLLVCIQSTKNLAISYLLTVEELDTFCKFKNINVYSPLSNFLQIRPAINRFYFHLWSNKTRIVTRKARGKCTM